MKDQLNTLNLRNNHEERETEPAQQEEDERFYQEERIRRAREEARARAIEQEQLHLQYLPPTKGVGKITFLMMLTVAILADITLAVISWIPFVGWFINFLLAPVVFLTFFVWFKTKGIKYNSARKIAILPIGLLIELIPYLNILPGWTVSIIANTKLNEVASKAGF